MPRSDRRISASLARCLTGRGGALRWSLLALALAISLSGCVRRRLFVRSDPPGAAIYIDDQHVGYTPTYVNYTYYGSRKVQLIKDGYETVTVYQRLDPPWYEYPPIDFVSENLVPTEIRDERILDFTLPPSKVYEREQVLPGAEALRAQVQQGTVVPLPPQTGSAAP
jgi:hypothetical protein